MGSNTVKYIIQSEKWVSHFTSLSAEASNDHQDLGTSKKRPMAPVSGILSCSLSDTSSTIARLQPAKALGPDKILFQGERCGLF